VQYPKKKLDDYFVFSRPAAFEVGNSIAKLIPSAKCWHSLQSAPMVGRPFCYSKLIARHQTQTQIQLEKCIFDLFRLGAIACPCYRSPSSQRPGALSYRHSNHSQVKKCYRLGVQVHLIFPLAETMLAHQCAISSTTTLQSASHVPHSP
jgi:hypothetical protein